MTKSKKYDQMQLPDEFTKNLGGFVQALAESIWFLRQIYKC